MMLTLLLTALITNSTLAGEKATLLKLGDLAPYSGVLITTKVFVQLEKDSRKVPLLEDKIGLQEDRVQLHREAAREARGELFKEQIGGNLKFLGGIVLGVLITGFAFKANQKMGEI